MEVPEFARNMINSLGLNETVGECGIVFTGECAKHLLSKCLGYGVVAGSSLVKVPQILNIVKSGSVEGISRSAVLLELVGYILTVAYCFAQQFPFSTYGESLFLMISGSVLAALVCRVHWSIATAVIAAVFSIVFTRIIPLPVLTAGQTATIPIFIISKIPQIILLFRTRNPGELSLITYSLNTLGAAARVFTTLQELGDPLMLTSSSLSTLLNGTIALQIVIFSRGAKKEVPKKEEEENKSQ